MRIAVLYRSWYLLRPWWKPHHTTISSFESNSNGFVRATWLAWEISMCPVDYGNAKFRCQTAYGAGSSLSWWADFSARPMNRGRMTYICCRMLVEISQNKCLQGLGVFGRQIRILAYLGGSYYWRIVGPRRHFQPHNIFRSVNMMWMCVEWVRLRCWLSRSFALRPSREFCKCLVSYLNS